MDGYTTRQVQIILGLTRGVITSLISAGFVTPSLGKHREHRFTFQDLVVMRMARGLQSAKVPPRRISSSLKRLRAQLPAELPLAGLHISAIGHRVVVRDGARCWQADTGQYLLDFDVAPADGFASFRAPDAADADVAQTWFDRACELEAGDRAAACAAYRRALACCAGHSGAYINLGRVLHEMGRLDEAEAAYREGIIHCPREALLYYNLGVLLEDLHRIEDAMASYRRAIEFDPKLADCHHNLALLYERTGRKREALRHWLALRKLTSER